MATTQKTRRRGQQRTAGVPRPWWRSAAIYEVYVRSFADGNGDGIGDLAGVRAKLPYL
ncbi:MAG: alpha-glucosidase, partial [Gaiellaceae bacterium]|nr:alpha-glucosidase [Gaiellaceae bacterium]